MKKTPSFFIMLLSLIAIIMALLSFILCSYSSLTRESEYSFIFLWPLLFFIFLSINFRPFVITNSKHKLALSLIVFTQMIPRYAIYPALVSLASKDYSGNRHIPLSPSEINTGVFLVALELVFFTLFVLFFENYRKKRDNSHPVVLARANTKKVIIGNKAVYLAFILLAFFVYLTFGRQMNIVQFATIETGYSEISQNSLFTLVKYIVSIGITLLALLIFAKEKEKYDKCRGNIHFVFALLAGILLTMTIVGESRGTQITIGLLVIFLLIEDYPNKKIFILSGVAISVCIVVLSITIFRTGSVSSLFGNSIDYLAKQFQIYYGGPDSVYQNIKVFTEIDVGLSNVCFDFIRSCFPFNLFIKGFGDTISQMYNLVLSKGMFTNGHIVFSASYGYIFFGIFGVPLTMCLNYFLASKSCEVYSDTNSYEIKYVAGFCMLKFVNVLFENTPAILGAVTQYIGTFGLLILVSSFFVRPSVKGMLRSGYGKI